MEHAVAEWRIAPHRDTSPRAELLRRVRARSWGAKLWYGGGVALLAFLTLRPKDEHTLPFTNVILGVLQLSSIFFEPRTPKDLLRMRSDPSPVIEFPVRLELRKEGHIYGEDDGLVSFVEGWLVYTGRDCAFSIARRDLLPGDRGVQALQGATQYALRLDGAGGTEVRLRSYDGTETGDPQTGILAFSKSVPDWLKGPDVGADGVSVLPPDTPHPVAWYHAAKARWLSYVPFVVFSWLAGLMLKAPAEGRGLPAPPVGPFTIWTLVCLGFLTFVLTVWRRYRASKTEQFLRKMTRQRHDRASRPRVLPTLPLSDDSRATVRVNVAGRDS